MSLLRFCEWLAATPWSIALHESHYLFLIILTVHVLTLCLLVGTALMVDLRMMGLTLQRVPASEVLSRIVPWTTAGFLIMIATGALLFSADPVAKYRNLFFRLKMMTLVLAVVNAWVFHRTVYRKLAAWDTDAIPPLGARLAGALSIAMWAALITLGRMIPYQIYWLDCARQPQWRVINLLMGC